MTDHEHAAREFLHSSEWLNAGDIFAQQKALADFAASLAPLPSDSHKQAAREIMRRGDFTMPASDDHPNKPMDVRAGDLRDLEEAIAAALARVERETLERVAERLCVVRALQEAKIASLPTELARAIAQSMIETLRISEENVRALAEEASREA